MNKNNLIKALKNTVLTGASIHLIILALYACRTKDLDVVNIFNILDFELVVPELAHGTTYFIYSWVFISIIFFFMYFRAEKEKKNEK